MFLLQSPATAREPPLGAATIIAIDGSAQHGSPPSPLHAGDHLKEEDLVYSGPSSRLALRFSDGTLLRLDSDSTLRIGEASRQIELEHGRVLIHSDLMIGGVRAWAPGIRCNPAGTIYMLESNPTGATVTVLDGVVRVSSAPTAPPILIAPGEQLQGTPKIGTSSLQLGTPHEVKLDRLLGSERLLIGWAHELPALHRITEHADEQRRGVLDGRNQRLKRELRWKRARPFQAGADSP